MIAVLTIVVQVVHLSQDSFYRELNPVEISKANKGMFNFDHPDAFDNQLMESVLTDIINGRQTKVPVYDFKTNSRSPGEFTTIYPSDVILVEGILVFYYPTLRNMFNMKLFVDTDADSRLARRVLRDIEERGRDLEHVLHQVNDDQYIVQMTVTGHDVYAFSTQRWSSRLLRSFASQRRSMQM